MGQTYDAIIIGGGHNGLVLGNYLTRAGLKTVILERRLEIGGGLSTEEVTVAGFLHNLHSYYHDTINVMPPFVDLELAEYNARYIRPPVQAGIASRNGQAATLHTDLDATCASIARVNEHDARTYREMSDNYGIFMETVVMSALYTPPQPPSQQTAILESTPEGLEFLRMGRLSPEDVVREYFESDLIRALILHQLPIPRGIVPDYHGLGTVIPLVVSQVEHSQICIGGSHVLAHALWRAFFQNGGMALGLSHVSEIMVENKVAVGVRLADGREIRAEKLVASSIDLPQTFLDLLGEKHLEEDFLQRVRNFMLDEFSVFGIHLALKEPPRHAASAFDPDLDTALKLNIGLETPEDYRRLWGQIRRGELPDHFGLFCSCPTLFDPIQAPPGYHTALIWQPAPYNLKDGGPEHWDVIKDEYMDRCIERWKEYAPNLTDDNILGKAALSPLDIERKLINMKLGGVFMGRMNLGQLEYFRPTPELSQFRTPIRNLYLCGACCHPGGGIIGAPGLIAAEIIAEDGHIERWW